ncbi:MAG: hypothetical protein LCH61_13465 [Proteobacteria bacterium]|nr:hypothetical protein [Pseudomonadota bacterium]
MLECIRTVDAARFGKMLRPGGSGNRKKALRQRPVAVMLLGIIGIWQRLGQPGERHVLDDRFVDQAGKITG